MVRMRAKVNCPTCQKKLEVISKRLVNKRTTCPACDADFMVQYDANARQFRATLFFEIPPTNRASDLFYISDDAANDAVVSPATSRPPSTRRDRRIVRGKHAAIASVCLLSLCCVVGAYAAMQGEFRIWRTSGGQRSKVKLAVVDKTDSNVRLKREDNGKEFELPIAKLSKEDRDYVKSLESDDPRPAREFSLPQTDAAARSSGSSTDFAQWRGDNRDGYVRNSPRLASSWPSDGPRELWTSDRIPSEWSGGWGSVAVSGNRAFVYVNVCPGKGAEGPIGNDIVYCLNVNDGETMWKYEHDGGSHNSPSNSTPTIADGRCYVHGSGGMFYCIDVATGNEVWVSESERKPHAETSSSIAVGDGVAVVLAEQLTGLDRRTGRVMWTEGAVKSRHTSPALWKHRDQTFAICNTGRGLCCVDIQSGELAWKTRRGNGEASPVVVGDVAIQMTRGELIAFDLTDDDADERWRVGFGDEGASPVVFDGHVYAVKSGGETICVRLSDGEVQWRENVSNMRYSSPLVADGKLFMAMNKDLFMLTATSNGKQVLDQANLDIEGCTSPTIAGGKLFVRQRAGIACYDLR